MWYSDEEDDCAPHLPLDWAWHSSAPACFVFCLGGQKGVQTSQWETRYYWGKYTRGYEVKILVVTEVKGIGITKVKIRGITEIKTIVITEMKLLEIAEEKYLWFEVKRTVINEVKIIGITEVTNWVNARVKLNSQVHFGFWIKIRYPKTVTLFVLKHFVPKE